MSKKWRNLVGIPLMGLALASTIGVSAVAADYYASITNTSSGTTLASSLHTLIKDTHTNQISYGDLWTLYKTSDVFPGTTKVWDTYSEHLFTVVTDQAGSYSTEGDVYNREHTVPQSWFGEDSPMVADAHHILATDGYVNNKRSSYLYGEVSSASYTSKNGSKLGTSSLSGYSGTVFEPIDEYKGDIARGYFYMAIRYSDKVGNWTSGATSVFESSYPYLSDYALDLFTKWSHLDPVSDKETIRNEAIADEQGNRNPFIDHPEWIDTIWSNSYTDTASNTKYSASDVVSAVSALTSSSSDDAVYGAYAKYCRLNTNDKSSVTNASTLFSYVESKSSTSTDLDTYWATIISENSTEVTVDQDEVDNVIALIGALPSTISGSDADQVSAANTAYQALNSAEKALVTNYSTLEAALEAIEDYNNQVAAQAVIDLIAALPSTITESDVDQVNAANTAYQALTSTQKALVTNYSVLVAALAAVEELSNTTYTLVTDASNLAAGDEIIIAAAAYDYALGPVTGTYYREAVSITKSDDTITLSDDSTVTVLTLADGTTSGTLAFNTGDGYLVPNTSTYKNLVTESSITVNSSYNISISSGVATIVSNGGVTYGQLVFITNSSYTEFTSYSAVDNSQYFDVSIYKHIVDTTLDQDEVDSVIASINALPSTITLSDEADIEAAEAAYNALNSTEKAAVTNYSTLVSARSSLDTLLAKIDTFEALSTKTSTKFSYTATTTGSSTTSYDLVTDASDLAAGDVIIIAASSAKTAFGAINDSIGTSVDIVKGTNCLTDIGDALLFTLVSGSTSGTYYLQNGSSYLTSTTIKKMTLQSSTSSASEWTITITSAGVATIVTNSTYALQYNANSPRFTTYTSTQVSPAIYKQSLGSTTTYTVSNSYIRFGAGMEKDVYEDLLDLGSSVSFGVSLSKDGSTYSNYTCTPAYVSAIGAKEETTNGAYVQYSVVIPVSSTNYEALVYAKCYVEIDGTKYYMNEASYSLHTLAQYYINNASTLGITDTNVLGALGEF